MSRISLSINQVTRLSNLSICVDDEKGTPGKPHSGLPQASHGINGLTPLRHYGCLPFIQKIRKFLVEM